MIVIVCGPPGSGKTTLATGLHQRLSDRGYAVDVLHSDDYERDTYEQMYKDVAEATEESSGEDVSNEADAPHLWIIDGTFYRRKLRNRFYRLDDVREVWVKASLEACLARNRERAEPIPEQGAKTIYGQFEPPRADLEIDTEALDVPEALDRLERAVLDWLDDSGAM